MAIPILLTACGALGQSPEYLWALGASNGLPQRNTSGLKSWVESVAVTPDGGSTIAGTFDGPTLGFGAVVLTNNAATNVISAALNFISQCDNTGHCVWARRAGTAQPGSSIATKVDPAANVYVVGHFSGSADFGGLSLTSSAPADLFVAKYNTQGNLLWARQYPDANTKTFMLTVALGVAADGVVVSSLSFESVTNHMLLAKYSSNGDLLWITNAVAADALAIDTHGFIYVTGVPGMLAQYDPIGNLVWSRRFPYGQAIAVDSTQNSYITGYGSGIYDGYTITNEIGGPPDMFVAKCDPSGALLWLHQAGSVAQERGTGIALDQLNNVYVTSASASANRDPLLTIGSTTLTNVYGFIAKYDASGNPLWAKGPVGIAEPFCVATVAPGLIYVGGYVGDSATFGSFTVTASAPNTQSLFLLKLNGALPGLPTSILNLPGIAPGNSMQFQVIGLPGFAYAVQASSNMVDWISLSTNDSPFSFTDTNGAQFPQRYYRAIYVP